MYFTEKNPNDYQWTSYQYLMRSLINFNRGPTYHLIEEAQ